MERLATVDVSRIEVGDMEARESEDAIRVVARAMSTSPLHLAVWGDPARAERGALKLFAALYQHFPGQRPLVARLDGRVIASTNDLLHDGKTMGLALRARMTPAVLAGGLRASLRVLQWTGAWDKKDPKEPHSHLGPLGVDPLLQGQGVGSLVLTEYAHRLAQRGEAAYLETDKPENVRLYERFGFAVTAEADVLGVPNWFMWRDAAR
jgi:ribosomal protein S18 acetylase RimI-like enzyme